MSDAADASGPARLVQVLQRDRGRLVGYVRRRLSGLQGQDPEDLLSEVVLTLLERADLLAEVENLTAYLCTALARRVADLFRRKALPPPEPPPPPALRGWEELELRQDVGRALALLSVVERAVWVAVELEGWTFAELSRLWAVPIGTLLARKARAGKRLRHALDGGPPAPGVSYPPGRLLGRGVAAPGDPG
ncbi:RNA polymerase sigma factor [mine drainage metagenome]|uniref:RNA polymerase sigma factor n=1 Tax=mine drainage metagenome TaxID=410659 RepID=A0A1J5RWM0_9ZZZZ